MSERPATRTGWRLLLSPLHWRRRSRRGGWRRQTLLPADDPLAQALMVVRPGPDDEEPAPPRQDDPLARSLVFVPRERGGRRHRGVLPVDDPLARALILAHSDADDEETRHHRRDDPLARALVVVRPVPGDEERARPRMDDPLAQALMVVRPVPAGEADGDDRAFVPPSRALRLRREAARVARLATACLVSASPLLLFYALMFSSGGRPDARLEAAIAQRAVEWETPDRPPFVRRPTPELNLTLGSAALVEKYLRDDQLSGAPHELNALLRQDAQRARPRSLAAGWPPPVGAAAVLHTMGVARANAGETEAAHRTLARAARAAPESPAILLDAAAVAARLGRWPAAEHYALRANRAERESALPGLLLAAIHLAQGKVRQGAAGLRTVAAAHPADAPVQEAVGRTYLAYDELVPALAAFEHAARLAPGWAAPPLAAGVTCLQLLRAPAAERHFRKAATLAPESGVARFGVGYSLELQGRAPAALPFYDQALAADPDCVPVLNDVAYLLAQRGRDLERAHALALRATTLDPGPATCWDTLGWVCYRAGRLNEAVAHLQQALAREPGKAVARYHLARALADLGEATGAAAQLRTALGGELPPEERNAARVLLVSLHARAQSVEKVTSP